MKELTDATEHIARTEDLSVLIPVDGDDEIARLAKSFNAMTAALPVSRDRQQQLIADAGHELRTPLTSLRTNIELLIRSEKSGRELPAGVRSELLTSVGAQITELADLIGDLQELSRPDAKPGSASMQLVALHEVAGRALERARLRGKELEFACELEDWFVWAEPAALERAVVNVLDNTVKFSPTGSTVTLRLQAGRLAIDDQGPGIPSDELPYVFERFRRSPSARSLPGSGLGLAIVTRAVHPSGGRIELLPASGGGTSAVMTIPGARVAPPEAPPPMSDAPVRHRPPPTRTRLTVSAHPARQGPTGTKTVEKLGRPADAAHPYPSADPKPAQKPVRRSLPDHVGGSRLSGRLSKSFGG